MALKARLDRVVISGDQLHAQIYETRERGAQEFTILEDIPLYLKLRLKDKKPPCTLRFIALEKNQNLDLFYSMRIKEPSEENNHGHKF